MKLKKSSVEAAEEAKSAGATGGAFISARLRNPAEEIAAVGADSGDKIGGILAIVATVMLAVIAGMLYMNWDLIKSA